MKRFSCYFLIFTGALVAGAVLFLGILSIWTGISHQEREGFWTPVITGSVGSALILYLFFLFARRLFRQVRRTDALDL
jgi:uncharacterized membrane protein HdeD (DUF308 family)